MQLPTVTCRYLRPDSILHRILADMGRTQAYVPATNTEQDVLETVFSPHRRYPTMLHHRQRAGVALDLNDLFPIPLSPAPSILTLHTVTYRCITLTTVTSVT